MVTKELSNQTKLPPSSQNLRTPNVSTNDISKRSPSSFLKFLLSRTGMDRSEAQSPQGNVLKTLLLYFDASNLFLFSIFFIIKGISQLKRREFWWNSWRWQSLQLFSSRDFILLVQNLNLSLFTIKFPFFTSFLRP